MEIKSVMLSIQATEPQRKQPAKLQSKPTEARREIQQKMGDAKRRHVQRAVGIERDEAYFAIAKKRIDDALASSPNIRSQPHAEDND